MMSQMSSVSSLLYDDSKHCFWITISHEPLRKTTDPNRMEKSSFSIRIYLHENVIKIISTVFLMKLFQQSSYYFREQINCKSIAALCLALLTGLCLIIPATIHPQRIYDPLHQPALPYTNHTHSNHTHDQSNIQTV